MEYLRGFSTTARQSQSREFHGLGRRVTMDRPARRPLPLTKEYMIILCVP